MIRAKQIRPIACLRISPTRSKTKSAGMSLSTRSALLPSTGSSNVDWAPFLPEAQAAHFERHEKQELADPFAGYAVSLFQRLLSGLRLAAVNDSKREKMIFCSRSSSGIQ